MSFTTAHQPADLDDYDLIDHAFMGCRRLSVPINLRKNGKDDTSPIISQESSSESTSNGFRCFNHRKSKSEIPRLSRLESSISITSLNVSMPHMEERMRRRLKYFFMNPCQKYQAKRRKPFKLAIQILKIALVTLQLNLFGSSNQALVEFKQKNTEVFSRVFLLRNMSFITKSDVYDHINSVRKEYAQWTNTTVGIYSYPLMNPTKNEEGVFSSEKIVGDSDRLSPPVQMCVKKFSSMSLSNGSEKYDFNEESLHKEECLQLLRWSKISEPTLDEVSIPLRNGSQYHIDFVGLIHIKLSMHLETMRLGSIMGQTSPECYNASIQTKIDNSAHAGEMSNSIKVNFYLNKCSRPSETTKTVNILLTAFDVFIVILCSLSLILCARSVWKAQILRRVFEKFFQAQYNKVLSYSDRLEFLNMWYILIIISDILTILGSMTKIVLQSKDIGDINYDPCTLFLGVGCLCVWIGVLRYAGFFHQYNILVLTLKKSLPHVGRFMVCASLLYLGFMFCGWLVLGPYHHKFRSLVVTSEALFSLINGDDMYMTFEEMSKNSLSIFIFSQVYLYTFISLFIYVVLSLFIAVIMDTYETIKEWQDRAEPQQSELHKFIAPCTADASVENYEFDRLNAAARCGCCFGVSGTAYDSDNDINYD